MKQRILMVCMGNICRSPTAHAVMHDLLIQRKLTQKMSVDSAGTHGYHEGSAPNARSQETTLKHEIDMKNLSSRQVREQDYYDFDYIFAMDEQNLQHFRRHAPNDGTAKIMLFLASARAQQLCEETEVPDPYYGGAQGFDNVFLLVQCGCEAILSNINHK